MVLIRRVLFCVLAFALCGCAEWKARQQAQRDALVARWNAEDDAKCKSYGAVPGSDAYVHCRTQLDASRSQAALAEDAQIQAQGNALQQAGRSLQSINPPPPVTCTTVPSVGGMSTTTCR